MIRVSKSVESHVGTLCFVERGGVWLSVTIYRKQKVEITFPVTSNHDHSHCKDRANFPQHPSHRCTTSKKNNLEERLLAPFCVSKSISVLRKMFYDYSGSICGVLPGHKHPCMGPGCPKSGAWRTKTRSVDRLPLLKLRHEDGYPDLSSQDTLLGEGSCSLKGLNLD